MGFGSSVDIKKLPNMQDILAHITDEDIFAHYLGGIPRKPICSPIRKDKIPSFSIFYSDKYEKLMYKDFATGDRGDVFVFVMKLLGLARITDAFCVIASEFQLTQFQVDPVDTIMRKSYVEKGNVGKVRKDRIEIKVKVRPWNELDRKYWQGKYGFTKEELEYCGIFPITHYFMNEYCRVADNLAYAFQEMKDGVITYKIYQPNNPDYKWVNNNDFSTWELWRQLPDSGKNLIITSSRKDAMVIKKLYPSHLLTSCALQSENTNAKESVIDHLKTRFKNIYVLYDNDSDNEKNPGRTAGARMCEQFGLTQLEIPTNYKLKDPSDFLEQHGREELRSLIKKLIHNANKQKNNNEPQ